MKQYLVLGAAAILLVASPVMAQSNDPAVNTEAQVEVSANVNTFGMGPIENEPIGDSLDGVQVEAPKNVPSGFGFFWRGFKERVSLLTTLNPVKKAEKQLKFAEERLQVAKTIAEQSNDPKVQAKAEAMVVKANEYIQKIEDKKDAWIEKKDERSERLLKNIATHELNREKVMDRLEEKLPEEQAAKIRDERKKQAQQTERLLNAIGNANIPEDVRAQLEEIKQRIEAHAAEQEAFETKRQELLGRLQSGDESAQAELETLKQKRYEAMKARVEDARGLVNTVEQKKADLIKKANAIDVREKQEVRSTEEVKSAVQEKRNINVRPVPPRPDVKGDDGVNIEARLKQEIMKKEVQRQKDEDEQYRKQVEAVKRMLEEGER